MTTDTLILTLTIATLTVTSLGVLAIRHRSKRFILLSVAGLVVIAIAFVAPHYAETADLFILFRLMIMFVVGAASLAVLVVCMIFGLAIGVAVVLGDVLLAKKGERLPLWLTIPICVIIAVPVGLALAL